MLERLKSRLVADARNWWRWSSVRFALVAGAVTSWAASDPTGFAHAVNLLPNWAQPLVGVGLSLVAILLRVTKAGETADVR